MTNPLPAALPNVSNVDGFPFLPSRAAPGNSSKPPSPTNQSQLVVLPDASRRGGRLLHLASQPESRRKAAGSVLIAYSSRRRRSRSIHRPNGAPSAAACCASLVILRCDTSFDIEMIGDYRCRRTHSCRYIQLLSTATFPAEKILDKFERQIIPSATTSLTTTSSSSVATMRVCPTCSPRFPGWKCSLPA